MKAHPASRSVTEAYVMVSVWVVGVVAIRTPLLSPLGGQEWDWGGRIRAIPHGFLKQAAGVELLTPVEASEIKHGREIRQAKLC